MKHRLELLIVAMGIGLLALALALIAAGGPPAQAQGDIIYVDADAPGPGDGQDWTTAYTDLQDALADAEAGQQIWVAAGTYTPTWQVDSDPRTATFQMVNGVAIYGGFDPSAGDTEWDDRDWVNNVTILSGNIGDEGTNADNSYHVFHHAGGLDSTAILDGFTISGGNADGTHPDDDGAGMYNNGSSPTLVNCTFTGNSAGYAGGGMENYGGSSPTMANCTFEDNSAGQEGGAMRNNSASPTMANCTFYGNEATNSGGGIYNTNDSAPTLTNCILWGDSPDEIVDVSSMPDISYSDIQGGYPDPGETNIDADPLFVDAGAGDLRLQLTSPAIDAGDSTAPGLAGITTDLGGHPRFADVLSVADTGNGDPPIVDMGAYEAPSEVIHVDRDATGSNDGASWLNAFTDLQDALDAALAPAQIWVAAGTYKPTDDTNRTISFQMKNGVAIYGGFDPTSGADTWEERDWVLHETVLSGDLLGNDGPEFANRYDNSYHVFYHPGGLDSTAILDGFTITGGNANGASPHNAGGGMRNSDGASPTLTGCTFTGNSAGYGGGMYNIDSAPVVTGCTFEGNSAVTGGGIYNIDSAPVVTGCTFSGNSAISGGGMATFRLSPMLTNCTFSGNAAVAEGGGMLNYDSSPVLTNCTFSGNSATEGGGMYSSNYSSPTLTGCTFSGNSASSQGGAMLNGSYSSPTLINCVLWGDASPEISNSEDSAPVVSYSDVQGGYTGEGNIDADPLFLDAESGDLHLGPGSPCIDAGSNTAPSLPDYDFEGDARIMDGDGDGEPVVDMGVDEALWHPVYLPLVLRAW